MPRCERQEDRNGRGSDCGTQVVALWRAALACRRQGDAQPVAAANVAANNRNSSARASMPLALANSLFTLITLPSSQAPPHCLTVGATRALVFAATSPTGPRVGHRGLLVDHGDCQDQFLPGMAG